MISLRRSLPVAALLFAVGCGHAPTGPAGKAAPAPLTADLVTVAQVEWPLVVRIQGSLHADETATLASRVAGLVNAVKVDRGQVVTKGTVLVELRTSDFDLKVTQAQAALQQIRAKVGLREGQKDSELDPLKAPPVREAQAVLNDAIAKLDRARGLRGTGAASEEEVQTLRTTVEVAQARGQTAQNQVRELIASIGLARAELALAEQAREDAEPRAPFDGIVEAKLTAPGAVVSAGTPLVTLVRTHPLRFTAGVPERRSLQVQPGQKAIILLEDRTAKKQEPLVGQVTRVSPALALTSRALTVEVDVPNPDNKIPANFFAEADILVDPDAKTLAIPLLALSEFAGVEKVWVVKDGQAADRRVRTGRRNFAQVEVLEGLQAGEVVLADARLGRPGPVKPGERGASAP